MSEPWVRNAPVIENGSWTVDGQTYTHRALIEVLERSGAALTNYPVRLDIDTKALVDGAYATATGNEVRFTTTDGTTLVKFWRETAFNTDWGIYWFKAPTIAASTIVGAAMTVPVYTNFYIYFDAALGAVPDGQDGGNTFDFYDHFPGAAIDTDKWEGDTGSATVASSIMTLTGASTVWKSIQSKVATWTFGAGYKIRSRAKYPTLSAECGASIVFRNAAGGSLVDLISYVTAVPANLVALRHIKTATVTGNAKIDENTYHVYTLYRRSTTADDASEDDVNLVQVTGGDNDLGSLPAQLSTVWRYGSVSFLVDWIWVGQCTASEDTEPLATPMTAQVIFPAAPYTVVVEPNLIYEATPQLLTGETNVWKCWFRDYYYDATSVEYAVVSYAESTNLKHWVYARGVINSGEKLFCPFVMKGLDGVYYCYVHGGTWLLIDRWASANGYSGWAKDQDNTLQCGAAGQWDDQLLGNVFVWEEAVNDWRMIYEASGDGAIWRLGYATGADGMAWNKSASNPVMGDGIDTVGGPEIHKIGSTYYNWTQFATAGSLPCDLRRYSATILTSWTSAGEVFARAKTYEGAGDANGQVADPSLCEQSGISYMVYDCVATQAPPPGYRSTLALAVYPGTLGRLVATFGPVSGGAPMLIGGKVFGLL